jgi:hypothetical protein
MDTTGITGITLRVPRAPASMPLSKRKSLRKKTRRKVKKESAVKKTKTID